MNTPTPIHPGPPGSDSWKETVSTLARIYEFSTRETISMQSITMIALAPRKVADVAIEMGASYQAVYYIVKRLCESGYLTLPDGAREPYRRAFRGNLLLSKLNKHLHEQPTC